MASSPSRSALLMASIFLSGCSLFGPRMQTIMITSEPLGADVIINGGRIGPTPLQHQVRRGEDLLIEIREDGYTVEYRHPHRTLSTLGILDVAGGAILLIPFFGLLSSAAWEHEPSSYAVILTPRDEPPDRAN